VATGILIADDHRILRQGLRTLIEGDPDLDVLGEAEDGRQAVRLARKLHPDVVIMDVAMPELNGMDATHRIRKENPDTRVLALSMHADHRFVREMLQAGASGYLLKDSAFEELALAIRTVLEGKVYLSPSIQSQVVSDYLDRDPGEVPERPPLTRREREVLQLLAEGKSTRDCAGTLNLSVKTVETYRKRIFDKLEIRTLPELTKYAIREGYIQL
jgi:DNA-binding NarL/FixJ family response regulator